MVLGTPWGTKWGSLIWGHLWQYVGCTFWLASIQLSPRHMMFAHVAIVHRMLGAHTCAAVTYTVSAQGASQVAAALLGMP